MQTKNNLSNLSVVIASIGEDFLLSNIEKMNNNQYLINEIIVIIPKKFYKKKFKNYKNVKFVFTEFEGQVKQRIHGFNIANNNFVMQLDCDCLISSKDINSMIYNLIKLGKKNAIAPIYFEEGTNASIHRFPDKIADIPRKIVTVLVCGAKYGILRMGTISKVGTNYGIDPKYMINDLMQSQWLPGGCVLYYKEDLLIENYYPFDGKAFCEDLIHCYMLTKRNMKLWVSRNAKCYTEKPYFPIKLKEVDAYLNSYNYFNQLQTKSIFRFRFRLWFFLSQLRKWYNFFIKFSK